MSEELCRRIREVTGQCLVMAMATVENGAPRSRYMAVTVKDDFKMYAASGMHSRKIGQLRTDPRTHLLGGYDPQDMQKPWIAVHATAAVRTDAAIKQAAWTDDLNAFFSGPEDENYCVLEITPSRIEYWTMDSMQPQVLEI